MVTRRDLPDIKLIRTDTTLDLSHVAEKIEARSVFVCLKYMRCENLPFGSARAATTSHAHEQLHCVRAECYTEE